MDPALTAALIRNEAIQHLSAMNVDKGFRRALLRKTHNTKVPDLQPPPGPSSEPVRSPTEEPSLSTATLAPSEPLLPQMPLKRPFGTFTALLHDSELVKVNPDDDYRAGVFGPKANMFYRAYLSSQHRKDDVPPDKPHDESDATDTDHGGPSPGITSAKRQLSRKEQKQLDGETPWTQILRSDQVPEYLQPIH